MSCTENFVCNAKQRTIKWKYLDCIPKFFCRSPQTLVLLTVCCFAFSMTWAIFRHSSWAWIIQDIIGYFFCIFTITELRFPSFKILAGLQFSFFLYDVFMVYITPYLTPNGDSVMVQVATGGGSSEKVPFLFLVPHLLISQVQTVCEFPLQFSMLGFGDIIIPGFTGGYCAFFDMVNSHAHYYYFWVFLLSYGVGLILTFGALIITGMGQPALFFLVPTTLGSLALLAYVRREFKGFWNGPKLKESVN